MASELDRLTLRELEIFGDLARICSIREVSRWRDMEVGQVSRILKRLETRLQAELFKRSHRGLVLTPEGQRLKGIVDRTLEQLKTLGQVPNELDSDAGLRLGPIGAPSFLAYGLVAPLLGQLHKEHQKLDTELCEIVPDRIVLSGLRGFIDVAFHAGTLDWSRSWTSEKVGTVTWKLYCNKDFFERHNGRLTADEALAVPYIYPTYWSPEGLRIGNDHFPIALRRRNKAFGVSTIHLARQAILASDAVGFLPEIAVYTCLDEQIIPIEVEGVPEVKEDIFLSVHEERVSKKVFDLLISQAKQLVSDKSNRSL